MKKNTIILFLSAMFYNSVSYGQTVSINALAVNNVSINSTAPINLESVSISNISLSTQVLFPNPQNNTGTINVYYQKNTSSPAIIANGGSGGNLLFNGGNSATRSFNITLDAIQFDASGGFLYTEYKTYSGIKYKSSNIPIIKLIPTPTNPLPPSYDPNYASQLVPYGGIPLLPKFANYYNVSSQDWIDGSNNVVLTERNAWNLYSNVTIRQRTIFTDGTVKLEPQKMGISVTKFFPNFNRLYVNNEISSNQYIPIGQTPQTIVGNQASESHSTESGTVTNFLNNYQWQKRIIYPLYWNNFNYQLVFYGWSNIPGATQANYTPPSASRGIEYRRLVIENPSDNSISRNSATSNIIGVFPISNINIGNTICCDQTVYSNSTANPIVGPLVNGSVTYQWQASTDGIKWYDIYNANNKDYNPVRPYSRIPQVYYRRVVLNYGDNLYYLSNVVKIIFSNSTGKISDKKIKKADMNDNSIVIYPNPSSSIINIDGIDNIASFQIKVIDLTGKTIISKKPNQSDNNSLQLDISILPIGVYLLELENEFKKFSRKIIKN